MLRPAVESLESTDNFTSMYVEADTSERVLLKKQTSLLASIELF